MPSDDSRRITETGARQGELNSIFREPLPPRVLEQDTVQTRKQHIRREKEPSAGKARIQHASMALRPQKIDGGADRRRETLVGATLG